MQLDNSTGQRGQLTFSFGCKGNFMHAWLYFLNFFSGSDVFLF